MTTSSIASSSPIMSASVMQNLSRAPETTPPETVSSLRNANGPASVRTGLQIIPSPNDAEAALQSLASQIARLQSNPEQPTARAASEAYMTQAAARTQITLQEQAGGSRGIKVIA